MNTIEVPNPNLKLHLYFGQPLKTKNFGSRIDGWQPQLVTFRLPAEWSPVIPPAKNQHNETVHANGPAGATVTSTESGMTNLNKAR